MDGKRMTGAVLGALVAGLGITALLIAGEKNSGKPSEIVDLERKSADTLGLDTPDADVLPSTREQLVTQGGHLALSALAGATYAALTDDESSVLGTGLVFGAAFYVAMHWITGPLLGVKQPEWRNGRKAIGMHTINHLAFGVLTALGARSARHF